MGFNLIEQFDTGLIFVLNCMREVRTISKFLYTRRRAHSIANLRRTEKKNRKMCAIR